MRPRQRRIMNFVVIGSGRVGSQLSAILSADGHNVTIVDSDADHFNLLPATFSGRKVTGIEFDVDVLKEAEVGTADGIAIVTPNDNTNIMVAETIRQIFGNKSIVVRIYEPRKKKTYERLDLRGVSPVTLGAYQIYAELLSMKLNSRLPLNNGDFELLEIPIQLVCVDNVKTFERDYMCKIVGMRTHSKLIFPWIDEEPDDAKSWIILAPTSRLYQLMESFKGGL
jgi:Trk K+ transport system NAD-binding subunit